jgi:hypothetical protein
MLIFTLIDALNYVLFVLGIIICINAFRRRNNKGFIVIAIYFIVSFATMGIGRVLQAKYKNQMPVQTQESPAIGDEVPVAGETKNISLPIRPAILIVGIWMLGKDKSRNEEQNISIQGTS